MIVGLSPLYLKVKTCLSGMNFTALVTTSDFKEGKYKLVNLSWDWRRLSFGLFPSQSYSQKLNFEAFKFNIFVSHQFSILGFCCFSGCSSFHLFPVGCKFNWCKKKFAQPWNVRDIRNRNLFRCCFDGEWKICLFQKKHFYQLYLKISRESFF